MTDFTVDDVLSARPSLRERAKAAHDLKVEEARVADEAICFELEQHARQFMLETLGMFPPDVAEVTFTHGKKAKHVPGVYFTVDNLHFQVSYTRDKVMDRTSGEFASEQIWENVPVVDVRIQGSFFRVKCLEDIGAKL